MGLFGKKKAKNQEQDSPKQVKRPPAKVIKRTVQEVLDFKGITELFPQRRIVIPNFIFLRTAILLPNLKTNRSMHLSISPSLSTSSLTILTSR